MKRIIVLVVILIYAISGQSLYAADFLSRLCCKRCKKKEATLQQERKQQHDGQFASYMSTHHPPSVVKKERRATVTSTVVGPLSPELEALIVQSQRTGPERGSLKALRNFNGTKASYQRKIEGERATMPPLVETATEVESA